MTRRAVVVGAGGLLGSASRPVSAADRTGVAVIAAPSSLGLRPNAQDAEPGAWRAPGVLLSAGVAERLGARVVELDHPAYDFEPQVGTRVRNGLSIRRFSLDLAQAISVQLAGGAFPIVIGGDCSVLLGCLLGLRRAGGRGLVHVDGHSDFFHPGNYDTSLRLGSAAGMDLALATGRGELVLTRWPGVDGTLVGDDDAFQIGERDEETADFARTYGDIARTRITRFNIQTIQRRGLGPIAGDVLAGMSTRGLDRAWLHVDLDVLDQAELPAVDSPGAPGLTFAELRDLVGRLLSSGRFAGLDVSIYDPELDPGHRHAPRIVDCIAAAVQAGLPRAAA